MNASYKREHTKDAKDERGEVFTPESLCEEMLSRLPVNCFTTADKTIVDNSCGAGNFLVKTLQMRMKHDIPHLDAIKTLYGIELDENNATECRKRLSLDSTDPKVWEILNYNIVCADALDKNHKGWRQIGYMWERTAENEFFIYE